MLVLTVAFGIVFRKEIERGVSIVMHRPRPGFTVQERLEQFGVEARGRLESYFTAAGVTYPPVQITLLALKEEKRLELYAVSPGRASVFIRSYPVKAASGRLGPKLREGDDQVPEGFYSIESLNPNSRFHLALRLNYPNDFDRTQAVIDGRSYLGGDIMIHGSDVSIGCLAMGDEVAEELFVLAADTGLDNLRVLITPYDFRRMRPTQTEPMDDWVSGLYSNLAREIALLPAE